MYTLKGVDVRLIYVFIAIFCMYKLIKLYVF